MRNFAAAALALVLAVPSQAATITLDTFEPIFKGVDLGRATIDGVAGISLANILRIDLGAEGVSFTGSRREGPIETLGGQTSAFLIETGAQAAVNSGFFAPCCTAAAEPKDVIGLTVSDGVLVSPVDPDRTASILIDAENTVTIGAVDALPPGVDDAATGSDILLDDGGNVAPTEDNGFNGPNPRTAAGVTEDGATLFLLTIDGRQPGVSAGTTLVETAELLLALGAFDAVNLDGGGSTTMAISDGAGGATLINNPSGGAERFNGGNLAVFAEPLDAVTPIPLPPSLALLAVGALLLGAVRRRG